MANAKPALVVDNDWVVRDLLTSMLREAGFDPVFQVTSGAEAISLTQQGAAKLVLLDIELPDISGLVCLEQILAARPNTPVVMVSAENSAANVRNALGAGAKGFIVKPFTAGTVFSTLRRLQLIPESET